MVMEYMDGGDLRSFLLGMRENRREFRANHDGDDEYYSSNEIKSSLTAMELLHVSFQAANGLDFLASQKVKHNFLLCNIIMAEDMYFLLMLITKR